MLPPCTSIMRKAGRNTASADGFADTESIGSGHNIIVACRLRLVERMAQHTDRCSIPFATFDTAPIVLDVVGKLSEEQAVRSCSRRQSSRIKPVPEFR